MRNLLLASLLIFCVPEIGLGQGDVSLDTSALIHYVNTPPASGNNNIYLGNSDLMTVSGLATIENTTPFAVTVALEVK